MNKKEYLTVRQIVLKMNIFLRKRMAIGLLMDMAFIDFLDLEH